MSKNLWGVVAFSIMCIYANLAAAQTANSVYIDQVGSGSTIGVIQSGSNNTAGTDTKNMVFSGNTQVVSIQQIGSNNIADVNVQGAGATLTSTVAGSMNSVTISCGTGGVGASAACTDSNLIANATGDSNLLSITAGAKTDANINITGDRNNAGIISNTTSMGGARASIAATGNDNILTIDQSGPAGVNGFTSSIDVTGSSNTVGVTQSGTIDSTVNVKSVGSNNSITVRSGNSNN